MIDRDYMIKSILGYSQLSFYNNSKILYWFNNSSDINFKLNDITADSLEILKKFHFIISEESIAFLNSLDHITNNLIISSKKNNEFKSMVPSGQINWNKTINTRLQLGYYTCKDYICIKNSKTLNTIENILLKSLLNTYKIFINEILNINNNSNIGYDLVIYEKKISELLDNELFKHIDDKLITSNSIKSINSIRRSSYKNFIKCINLFIKVFIEKDTHTITKLIAKQSLINLNDHKLYEIYCLFKIYLSLDYICEQKQFNILGLISKNSYCAKYTFHNGILEIRFQTLPNELIENKYTTIMRQCDLNISNKSPDIFFTWKPSLSNNTYNLFLEIKHSSNLEYFKQSIYKAFGYIYDFNKYLNHEYKGILLFSEAPKSTTTDDLIIINNSDFKNNISKIISYIISKD